MPKQVRVIMKEKLKQLNDSLLEIVRDIRVLSPLNWPAETEEKFMRALQNNKKLPQVEYSQVNYDEKLERLDFILHATHDDHPAFIYLRQTAESYYTALRMLQSAGTKKLTDYSIQLYGKPDDPLPDYPGYTHLDTAHYFLNYAKNFESDVCGECWLEELSAEQLQEFLQDRTKEIFTNNEIGITLDSSRIAKVSATSGTIKIRSGATFTRFAAEQLLNHEILTHALTSLNGRAQSTLSILGVPSPRTTMAQEGLASFAELITGWLDMARLKRLALRIIAIDMALKGADAVEVFKFFEQHVDNSQENYYSTARIFRGGQPNGGIVFTKDNVYLRGLMEVHSFFIKHIQDNDLNELAVLFTGKLAIDDISQLHVLMDEGLIDRPKYLPEWFEKTHGLAARLAFSSFVSNLELGQQK